MITRIVPTSSLIKNGHNVCFDAGFKNKRCVEANCAVKYSSLNSSTIESTSSSAECNFKVHDCTTRKICWKMTITQFMNGIHKAKVTTRAIFCRYFCLCCPLNLLKLMVTRTSYNYLPFSNKQIHCSSLNWRSLTALIFRCHQKFRPFS